ncbi:acyltransferase family protein [Roseateles chitosanitabidus]|uniref:acyltransferase family protein n=1 Tax=Roseateles chitosanitabidus TaxID=65048 RepID=UPI000834F028|nr:acyltransferase [Roseateles chitosanitabidus]MBO9685675.1 acyltransferase [Roseateles chitosanitabidus]
MGSSAAPAPAPPDAGGYRPWIDGLRALAMLLVLADHSNLFKVFPLGKVGVGVFFAISGFLITGILMDERARRGAIDLRRFYLRRLARLMPGLVLVVIVGSIGFLLLGQKKPVLAGLFAVTYTTNYAAIFFGQHLPGFGHAWSLAVEEHFYLVWPVALLAMLKLGLTRAMLLTLAIALLDIVWRGLLVDRPGSALMLYVGTIERIDAILYGCLAAMALRRGWRAPRWLGAAGLAMLIWLLFLADGYQPQYSSALYGIAGTALVAGLDTSGMLGCRALLSWRPVVWLGLLSYSLYLWHLPVYQIVEALMGTALPVKALAVGLTFVLAAIAYRGFEVPVRDWARRRIDAGRPPAPAATDVAPVSP